MAASPPRHRAALGIAGLLVLICLGMMALRASQNGLSLAALSPRTEWMLSLQVAMDLHGESANARLFLPRSDQVQIVRAERVESGGLSFSVHDRDGNRQATFQAEQLQGHQVATWKAIVRVVPQRWTMPERCAIPSVYPDDLVEHLRPTEAIQSDDPEIIAVARRLAADGDLPGTVRRIFDFVHQEIRSGAYENTIDARTTLRWKDAYCGGKSRLLVALLRASGIPARMIGGLILERGAKRTIHAWVEASINGMWVPFDALNDHYAERPGTYLQLYQGDKALVNRTSDVNFQYIFQAKAWKTPPDEQMASAGGPGMDTHVLWEAFRRAEISLNLLRILLTLPVGVLILVLLRNVVGLRTMGTFAPALLAVAFRDTGLLWGVAVFSIVILVGIAARSLVDRLQLLHLPRLSVSMTATITAMLVITWFSVQHGYLEAAHVTMFPIAILTLTIENAFQDWQERGVVHTLKLAAGTLLSVSLIHLAIEGHFLQAVVFAFPEVLLVVLASYLVLGRYAGLRLFEIWRFRTLANKTESP